MEWILGVDHHVDNLYIINYPSIYREEDTVLTRI